MAFKTGRGSDGRRRRTTTHEVVAVGPRAGDTVETLRVGGEACLVAVVGAAYGPRVGTTPRATSIGAAP